MIIPSPISGTNTNLSASPLQQLAGMFQRAGIQPNMQSTNASIAPATQMMPDQSSLNAGMQPPPQTQPQISPLQGQMQNLYSALGGGESNSNPMTGQQGPQTSNLTALGNWINGTPVIGLDQQGNATDQLTAQPSFINSIYKMLP